MENIPKETETIAVKRSLRLAEKLKNAKEKFGDKSWWNTLGLERLILLVILFINIKSISSYIGQPNPYQTNFSGPIFPLLSNLLGLIGFEPEYSIQVINVFFFLLFPISFYYFIKSITSRKLSAFLSILLISLPYYPFAETRILSAFHGVDSAHVAGLSISFIALTNLLDFLKNGGARYLALSSIFAALVVLISPFGFATFLIFSILLTFSEILLGNGRLKFFRFVIVFLFAGSLAAFWYNPGFIIWMLTGDLGQEIRKTIGKLIPISLFMVPLSAIFGYLLFDRKPNLQPVFLASFFTISFLLISLVGGGVFPSHPSRYIPELGVSIAYLISIFLLKMYETIPLLKINRKIAKIILAVVFVVLMLFIVFGSFRSFDQDESSVVLNQVRQETIWKQKYRFGGLSSNIGLGISLLTFSYLLFLNIKDRKNKIVSEMGENK